MRRPVTYLCKTLAISVWYGNPSASARAWDLTQIVRREPNVNASVLDGCGARRGFEFRKFLLGRHRSRLATLVSAIQHDGMRMGDARDGVRRVSTELPVNIRLLADPGPDTVFMITHNAA